MSKYTTELRYICESLAGLDESKGYDNIMETIETARPKIFSFTYPIPDDYKKGLETKILLHYYTREIGQETYGLWKLRLQSKMLEIMEYYNQLYLSIQYKYSPFIDTDYTVMSSRDTENDGTNNGTSNTTRTDDTTQTNNLVTQDTGKSTNRYSDTPQGSLQNIENNTYLTNATIDDNTNTTTNTGTVKNTGTVGTAGTSGQTIHNEGKDNYTETVKGKRGSISYAQAMKEYRDSLINIDAMVINDLEVLFMQIY